MPKQSRQEIFWFYFGGKKNVSRLLRQRLEHDHNTKVVQITSIYSHIYTTHGRTRTKSVDDTLSFYRHRWLADNHYSMGHWTPPPQAATLSNHIIHMCNASVAVNSPMTLTSNKKLVCEWVYTQRLSCKYYLISHHLTLILQHQQNNISGVCETKTTPPHRHRGTTITKP